MKQILTVVLAVSLVLFVANAEAKRSGTYSFKSSNGKPYIGKSKDVDRRLKEHERSGKLKPSDVGSVQAAPNRLSPQGNSVVEKTRIRAADAATKGGLANKQNAPFSRKNK